jgi:hypothetical protein
MGLSARTVLVLRHSTDQEIMASAVGPDDNSKYSGFIIRKQDMAALVNTPAIFDSKDDAEGHMKKVIEAARTWEPGPQSVGESQQVAAETWQRFKEKGLTHADMIELVAVLCLNVADKTGVPDPQVLQMVGKMMTNMRLGSVVKKEGPDSTQQPKQG